MSIISLDFCEKPTRSLLAKESKSPVIIALTIFFSFVERVEISLEASANLVAKAFTSPNVPFLRARYSLGKP